MIVRATYTTTPASAKGWVRAVATRQDHGGDRHDRQFFDELGSLSREQAYQTIDQAAGSGCRYHYHLILSPDPKTEDQRRDLQLGFLTEAAMADLGTHSGQPILWAAAIHADHSRYRHIHILATLPRRLDRTALATVRESGGEECRMQRRELDRRREEGGAESP